MILMALFRKTSQVIRHGALGCFIVLRAVGQQAFLIISLAEQLIHITSQSISICFSVCVFVIVQAMFLSNGPVFSCPPCFLNNLCNTLVNNGCFKCFINKHDFPASASSPLCLFWALSCHVLFQLLCSLGTPLHAQAIWQTSAASSSIYFIFRYLLLMTEWCCIQKMHSYGKYGTWLLMWSTSVGEKLPRRISLPYAEGHKAHYNKFIMRLLPSFWPRTKRHPGCWTPGIVRGYFPGYCRFGILVTDYVPKRDQLFFLHLLDIC